MIISSNDKKVDVRSQMRGGAGDITLRMVSPDKGLPPHFRMLAEVEIPAGASIGKHDHISECEAYIITEGEGYVNDSGEERLLLPGDVEICYDGEFHSIENRSEKPMKMIAVIVTDK